VSALTKIFVILLVVLSIMVSSGLVVFVNRVEDYKTTAAGAVANANAVKTQLERTQAELAAAVANGQALVAAADHRTEAMRAQYETANRQILDFKGQIAQLNAQVASSGATSQGLQAALKAAQDNQAVLQAQILETRKSYDEMAKKNTEANLSISDLANRNQVLERQLRNAQEEIAAMQEESKLGGPRAAASSVPAAGTSDAGGESNVNLNGVIRATQTIGGIKYATISLGSADAVRKGMTFRVLGGAGGNQFLGYVTVNSVEPHEAVGRLTGPRVNEVTSENEVRTKL
jgi:hypothetical protein